MGQWILVIDQGTTGTTAVLANKHLEIGFKANSEFRQIFPQPGFVEHEGESILESVKSAVSKVLKNANARSSDIACIGIANQRETSTFFTKKGEVAHNFIVWQCRRTQEICDEIRDRGLAETIAEKTGLVLDPYFSASKARWLLRNVEGISKKAGLGDLLFGTVDTYLLHALTKGEVHATDVTNASRTMLMNLDSLEWDDDLLRIFEIPRSCLPQIKPSSGYFGLTKGLSFLDDGIPIMAVAGDQQAALFGQACYGAGDAKITLGTGAFLLMNTGEKKHISKHGLLTSVAYQVGERVSYCLEGSAFIAGAAVQWLRDGLGFIKTACEIETLALKEEDSGGLDFVPALAGLGAPYWKPEARGVLTGVSRGTNRAHIARAVLEGIALQNNDLLEAMEKDGAKLQSLKVDGGASLNRLLMQYHADFMGVACCTPKFEESTALGAAALAGLAAGIFTDFKELSCKFQSGISYHPSMSEEQRQNRIARWRKAVLKA